MSLEHCTLRIYLQKGRASSQLVLGQEGQTTHPPPARGYKVYIRQLLPLI